MHSSRTVLASAGFLVLSLALLLTPRPAMSAYMTAEGYALLNLSGYVDLNQVCYLGTPQEPLPCAGPSLTSSTGPQGGPPPNNGFSDFEANLATGQIKGLVSEGSGSGVESSSGGDGSYYDTVTMSLAPGATWPQTFTVRAVLKGTFPPNSGNSGYFTAQFSDIVNGSAQYYINESLQPIGSAVPGATYQSPVTINQQTAFVVQAELSFDVPYNNPGTADYSTADSGLRFEIDLPPGLTMTSDSGVFLTKPLNGPPVCGDGVIEGTEQCDDGNTVNGDGCSSTCQVESGFTCNGASPTNCTNFSP